MPRLNKSASQGLREGMIAFFEKHPTTSMLEVARHLGVSRVTASRQLTKLQEAGCLERIICVLKPTLPVEWLVTVALDQRATRDPGKSIESIKYAVLEDERFSTTVVFVSVHQAHSGCFVEDRMIDGYVIRLRTFDLETGAELGKFMRFVPGIAHIDLIHLHPVVGPCMEGGGDDK